MSKDGSIEFEWGDGLHRFRLGYDEAEELEEKVGCGLYRLMKKIQEGDAKNKHIREVIRIGMIGGGASPGAAMNLIRRYYDQQPKLQAFVPALRILQAFFVDENDEPVGHAGNGSGKTEAEEIKTTAASPSPTSTH